MENDEKVKEYLKDDRLKSYRYSLENALAFKGVNTEFIQLEEGFSRINLKIKDKAETEINGKGPHVSEDKLQLLYKKIEKQHLMNF